MKIKKFKNEFWARIFIFFNPQWLILTEKKILLKNSQGFTFFCKIWARKKTLTHILAHANWQTFVDKYFIEIRNKNPDKVYQRLTEIFPQKSKKISAILSIINQ